jgi:hypothetical protein
MSELARPRKLPFVRAGHRVQFFKELAELSERMIAAHGKEFLMGALVLAARFIAENKPFERSAVTQ